MVLFTYFDTIDAFVIVDTADQRDLHFINHWLKRINFEASSILLYINFLLLGYGFRKLLFQRLTCVKV